MINLTLVVINLTLTVQWYRREEWVLSCQTTNRLKDEAKKKKWQEFVESLDFTADSFCAWRTLRALDNGDTGTTKNLELVLRVGRCVVTVRRRKLSCDSQSFDTEQRETSVWAQGLTPDDGL